MEEEEEESGGDKKRNEGILGALNIFKNSSENASGEELQDAQNSPIKDEASDENSSNETAQAAGENDLLGKPQQPHVPRSDSKSGREAHSKTKNFEDLNLRTWSSSSANQALHLFEVKDLRTSSNASLLGPPGPDDADLGQDLGVLNFLRYFC